MNQTRTFLLFALMAVAYFLWNAWEKDYGPQPAASSVAANAPDVDVAPTAAIPGQDTAAATPSGAGQLVTLSNDVLRLTIDTRGGNIVKSELLDFTATPRTRKNPDPAPTTLLDNSRDDIYVAQSGLVSNGGAAPDHHALFHAAQSQVKLASGQDSVRLDLDWQSPNGVKVVKSYVLKAHSYVVGFGQHIDNGGSTPWQGNAYEQLQRMAPVEDHGWWKSLTDPSSHSFFGGGWYSPQDKFQTLGFDAFKKHPLNQATIGGWISMLQHYFFVAWIPAAGEADTFSTAILGPDSARPSYILRAVSPAISVAPGQSYQHEARIYIGPKLQGTLDAVAPGLDLTTYYGWFTLIAQPLHWLLSKLEALCGNWGLAIILLVLVIKAAIWKLTALQFYSAARMRKLQPRVDALKERYGDDKMKMQQAMMDLYKKEKVNPMAGCLPVLITFPVFIGLYRVLSESVELRQAPFYGWIHDLSVQDPYFILPALYVLVMLATQWLTPPPAGMDPAQARMMKFMPLLFAVVMAFFPAGLVLYWIINGGTSLIQQWMIIRRVEQADTKLRIS
ncbi:membrane protein insertase YidC [Frateuria aurantia]|uniref:Membrane protein insertase YidC n=1 Tax=Frateuria aurantia (strain ATCC 33424 / DSM 6220 / KCTC 2777 / LMG 1558 / NBRC 3245 / NCIMB 13370) TaxID=767434 RepID=H8L1E2_FRAAD|nr:membrane protein insertase YidC [Frateuria aurantia]AFC87610.1 preprotein translocase subunit YidC [Frateuria aurantia DSM 6220]